MRPTFMLVLFPVLLLASCQRSETPTQGLTPLPVKSTDPLVDVAKAIPLGKAQIELTSSGPAGTNGEACGYEWTILAHVPGNEIPGLQGPDGSGLGPNDTWWIICRLTLRAKFDKPADEGMAGSGKASQPQANTKRLLLEMSYKYALPMGQGSANPSAYLQPGTPLTLKLRAWPQPKLGASFEGSRLHGGLEVPAAPLDDLVKPLFKTKETVDLQKPLPLLEVAGKVTTLEILP